MNSETKQNIYTSNPTAKYEMSWTIENISGIPPKLQSPPFAPIPGSGKTWCVELDYKNYRTSTMSTFDVKLVFLCGEMGFYLLEIKSISILNKNGDKCKVRNEVSIQKKRGRDVNKLLLFTNLENLRLPFSIAELLKLEAETIILNVCLVFSGYSVVSSVHQRPNMKSNSKIQLSKDLEHMYENSSMSDVTFSVEGKEVSAHKLILSARSPVFAKMFETEMLETKFKRVTITDVDFPIFECFLRYIYSGDVQDKSWNTVYTLYSVADKYQVGSLRQTCAEILGTSLSVDTVCKVLLLSYLHDDNELNKLAKDFIHIQFPGVAAIPEWKEIVNTYPKLALEVMSSKT